MEWSVRQIIDSRSGLLDFGSSYEFLGGKRWNHWSDTLHRDVATAVEISKNGHLPMWIDIYDNLPNLPADDVRLDQSILKVKADQSIDIPTSEYVEKELLRLIPWRKGPFRVHNTYIDSEWQSNLKWDRLTDYITPLQNRRVLDVGCGNGYYSMRMIGEGASFVVGMDPYLRYIIQFRTLGKFFKESVENIHLLPVPFEKIPENLQLFQTTFSMGVLYHHRSPFDHLQRLFESLCSGGELVLETMIVDGDINHVLTPEDRYTKMRNVWCIPSILAAENWLRRTGFTNIRTVDISTTSIQEQRSTRWMPFDSLADFLDPNDFTKSFEGYPAPKRAIILADKP